MLTLFIVECVIVNDINAVIKINAAIKDNVTLFNASERTNKIIKAPNEVNVMGIKDLSAFSFEKRYPADGVRAA